MTTKASNDMGPHCTETPPLLMTSDGQDWVPVQTCSLNYPLPRPLLTTGGYCSTYFWYAGGTFPTGMPSCLLNGYE